MLHTLRFQAPQFSLGSFLQRQHIMVGFVAPLDQFIMTVGVYLAVYPFLHQKCPHIALPQILIGGGSTAAPTRMSSSPPQSLLNIIPNNPLPRGDNAQLLMDVVFRTNAWCKAKQRFSLPGNCVSEDACRY
jgi:hypothetical protein